MGCSSMVIRMRGALSSEVDANRGKNLKECSRQVKILAALALVLAWCWGRQSCFEFSHNSAHVWKTIYILYHNGNSGTETKW